MPHPFRISTLMAILAAVLPLKVLAQSLDGNYLGKRVLTKGDAPPCHKQDDVSVTIRGDILLFSDGTLKDEPVGFGPPHSDGSFHLLHVEMGGRTVDIHGRIAGNAVDADVTNAPCEYHWHVEKK